jgi:hypothetical protein
MKPVFTRLDNPSPVQDIVALLKKKVSDANSIIGNLRRLRSTEDSEMASWRQEMNKAEQVMSSVQRELEDMH